MSRTKQAILDEVSLSDLVRYPGDIGNNPERMLMAQCLREYVARVMAWLPENESRVIRARIFDGKTQKVCSEELGIPLGRVAIIEAKGLKRIRRNNAFHKELIEFFFQAGSWR